MAMTSPQRLGTSQSEVSIGSRLSTSRREKLINLKKREDLKDALTSKFKGRFGQGASARGPDEMSVSSMAIREEVEHFAANADVTSGNLQRLERRIQNKARGASDNASVISGYSAAPSAAGSNLGRSRSVGSLAGANIVGSGSGAVGSGSPQQQGNGGHSWSRLDEYAAYLHEQDCIRQHMGVKALQRKLKSDLDHQVAMKNAKKSQESDEDIKYHQNSMIELERWKGMEKQREEEKHNKLMREKMDRDEQLNFERKLKDEELRKKKEEEASLVTKIVNEMEAEQRKFERKKEQTRKNMRKVFEENAADQERRNAEDKLTREREALALKEYARVLDEQEEQRNQEMQARIQRQNDLMAQLQANVDNIKQGASNNDEARAAAQQDEMDRHYFEAEAVKQNRLKQLRQENQAYLMKQVMEKDGRKEDERELQNIQAQILNRDTEEYNHIEKQKVIDRRRRLVENSNAIKEQMAYKLAQSKPVMTEAEMQMNKPLLQLVNRTLDARDNMPRPAGFDGEEED